MTQRLAPLLFLVGLWTIAAGCARQPAGEVVVYATVDQESAAPILSAFTRSEGKEIKPRAVFESASMPELSMQIILHANGLEERVQGDLFWDDAVLETLLLQERGLLAPHDWDVPADWPAIAEDRTWCGFAARARVLIVNETLLPNPAERPTSVLDLADPRWRDKCGIAEPWRWGGTSATHAAVLYEQLGGEEFEKFFAAVAENAKLLPSNSSVAQAVAQGRLAWGVTDSDAAILERDGRMPVAIIFPDQQPNQFGTLRIPNTVAILKDAPHPLAAKLLADYLVSPATEERFAMGDGAQIPLSRSATYQPRVLPPEGARWMEVDFQSAAKSWSKANEILVQTFIPE
ncbi:extracellular solute-binding protein [Candidatus Laterigemmans baculatus]|uniref:extracellular solute-binding protein n=1 Tax=Candidatus Laterigemmans baculatus TaxID=2770505 RepID=UPI0013D926DC|nr:extracellular solute-binding protein [Candidatus Laterigemmans baculatus]